MTKMVPKIVKPAGTLNMHLRVQLEFIKYHENFHPTRTYILSVPGKNVRVTG